jgi:beta-N-acetylhexosaminidase
MNLAPVVEALSDANRAFLVDRAWSADAETAGMLSGAFIQSCQAAGTAAVAKHFPGNAAADPHVGLPMISASIAELDGRFYGPFREAERRGVSSIMLSHAMVPALDANNPVSLSPASIAALKDGLGFGGIVMTDDLVMAALSKEGGAAAAAVSAMAAGADMLMISGGRAVRQARAALLSALESGSLPRSRLEDAAFRIARQKLRFGLDAQGAANQTLSGFASIVEKNGAELSAALKRSP